MLDKFNGQIKSDWIDRERRLLVRFQWLVRPLHIRIYAEQSESGGDFTAAIRSRHCRSQIQWSMKLNPRSLRLMRARSTAAISTSAAVAPSKQYRSNNCNNNNCYRARRISGGSSSSRWHFYLSMLSARAHAGERRPMCVGSDLLCRSLHLHVINKC